MRVSNPPAHLWGQGWRAGPLAGFQSVLHQQPLTRLKPNQITPLPAQYPAMASRSEWKPKSLQSSAGIQALCPWRSWLMSHTSPLADPCSPHWPSQLPKHTGTPGLWRVCCPLPTVLFPKVCLACSLNPSPPSGANPPDIPSRCPLSLPYFPLYHFHYLTHLLISLPPLDVYHPHKCKLHEVRNCCWLLLPAISPVPT